MRASLRDQFLEDIEKLRTMTWPERVRFIAVYYWLWISGILCGVTLIIYLAVHIAQGPPDYGLYVVFSNTRAEAGKGSALWSDFADYAGDEFEGKQVEFDSNSYFDYTRNQARGNTYYNAFVTLAETATLDAITMEPVQLAALGQSGRLLDWNDDRCAVLREKYADRLIWYYPEGDTDATAGTPDGKNDTAADNMEDFVATGVGDTDSNGGTGVGIANGTADASAAAAGESMNRIPVGIDVSDSLLVTKYGLYPDGCALGIGAYSGRLDAVEVFLSFILEGDNDA